MMRRSSRLDSAISSALLATLVLGGCAGASGSPGGGPGVDEPSTRKAEAEAVAPAQDEPTRRIEDALRAAVTVAGMESDLRELAAGPHVAGSTANDRLAAWIGHRFRELGYQVIEEDFEVLLPLPRRVTVELVRPVAFSATLREEPSDLDWDTHHEDVATPFVAFSPDADLERPLIYANGASRQDFARLREAGVEVRGRVAIARQGRLSAASQTLAAQEAGAAALLLYPDPADLGWGRGEVHPRGAFMPPTGVRRDSALFTAIHPGDPGTPGRPSATGAEQDAYDQMSALPRIPVACLSHADARPLLETIGGPPVPPGWQGGLPFTYKLGDGSAVVRLVLQSDHALRRIRDVIALWPGIELPDQQIVVGARRDAFVQGAIGAASGSAVMLEAARVLAERARAGDPPRRTLVFASWDAGAIGAMGATEWAEAHASELAENAVAYVDLDHAVTGDRLAARCSPVLAASIGAALGDDAGVELGLGGGAGGHAAFVCRLGVPSVRLFARGDQGVLGSRFDTFATLRRHVDPEWRGHLRLARGLAAIVGRLAHAEILPFRFGPAAASVAADARWAMEAHPELALDEILELADRAAAAAARVDRMLGTRAARTLPARLAIDAALMQTERLLVDADGLGSRRWYRHVLEAPDPHDDAARLPLPGLLDALRRDDRAGAQRQATRIAGALRRWVEALEALAIMLEPRP